MGDSQPVQHKKSNRLKIKDKNSSFDFLIDTGAEISALPHNFFSKSKLDPIVPFPLQAANGTAVNMFGSKKLELNLGLRLAFVWNFIVADVNSPIIGGDFLTQYGLLVDMKNRCLIDSVTQLRTESLRNADITQPSLKLINSEQSHEYKYSQLLTNYPEITNVDTTSPPIKTDVTHHIVTKGPPVYLKPRRMNQEKLEAAKIEISNLLKKGICQPSKSCYATPIHMAKSKDGTYRMCGDYRSLNKITVPDRYPIPYLQDFVNNLHGKEHFSKIDLKKAFHQVPVEPADIPKTALTTPFGLYEFKYMTFGLCNAAQTMQRLMDEVCRDLDFVFCYIDDVQISSKNHEEHMEHLRIFFDRLKQYNLVVNIDKCEFGKPTITFLGHTISTNGISPLKKKVDIVKNYKKPDTAMELKQFLAMINFYRRFIPHAVENQMLLNSLIDGNKKKDMRPVIWTPEAENAFEKCKEDLCNATVLSFPIRDAHLQLAVDASNKSIGAVLNQIVNNEVQPLAFFSKKLSNAKKKFSTYDRELIAIYKGVRHFKQQIEGRP